METRRCLSVIIPCYNEINTVEKVIKRVAESPWVNEIIAVDDGSKDGTEELLIDTQNAWEDENVSFKLIRQFTNRGKGAALRAGFQKAQSEYVVVQDADLEYDPQEYGILLAPLLDEKAEVVYGSRFKGGQPQRVLYFWHYMGNKFLTLMSNMFTDLNLTDMETCYKVFRREIIQSIPIRENRFGFEPEITAKVASGRWRVYEVGISYSGRTYDEGKKIGWKDGVRAVYCIIKYRFFK